MERERTKKFENHAVKMLEDNGDYATANAVKRAFSAWGCVEQYRWERDMAIEMLDELGLSLGQKIDGIYLSREEYEELRSNYESKR